MAACQTLCVRMSNHWRQPRHPIHRPVRDIVYAVVAFLLAGVLLRLIMALSV